MEEESKQKGADKGLKWRPLAFMAPIVAIIMQQSSSHYRHHHTALIIVTIICRGLSSSCQNHLQIIVQANTLYQILLHNSRGELVFSLLSKLYAVCCALPDCSIWVLPHIVVFPEHFVGCVFVLVYLCICLLCIARL